MPSQVYEEPLELEIGLLEAGPPTSDSYPYPSLAPTGRTQARTFRAVILENSFLKATFVPALGGRLLSLLDKRTGVEILGGSLTPEAGGSRGAFVGAGIEVHLDGETRLTSLGAVQYAAEEPDEDRPAGLWLAEAVTGTGMSWHLHVTLPEDRAELRLEARVFNRSGDALPYAAGLLLPASSALTDGRLFVTVDGGSGLAIVPSRERWFASRSYGALVLSRFDRLKPLAPRQLDTWSLSLIPFSGLRSLSAASDAGAMHVAEDVIQICAAARMPQHKLVLLMADGQTLEAPVDLYPEQILEIPVPGEVKAAALMDPLKNVVLRLEGEWQLVGEPAISRTLLPTQTIARDPEEATFDVGTRHFAHALLGARALAANDYEEAEERFEQALLYNGEDHLTWWMKAMAKRLAGETAEDIPELLNAHYLAPLEPVLRAESFLSQPRTLEKEPSALLKPFGEHPESFIEVAALLVETGLYEQASRWIDEALRHTDLPVLRYLLAYIHLRGTGMDFEIADQIKAASKQPLGPPYPWRKIEVESIEALAAKFPDDARLQELRKLIGPKAHNSTPKRLK